MTPSRVCSGSRVSVRRLLGSLLPILPLAVGCATWFPQPRQAPNEEGRRAVELLAARWQEFSDLRALVEIRLTHGRDRQQFTGVLLLKRPTSLRFEALSPFGQPLLLAAMHDGEVTTYDVAAHAALTGFDLSVAQNNVTGSVQYRDLVMGAGVDPERFRLTIPQGASIERLR